MSISYDFLALAAAACWAVGSTLSVTPARHLGAIAYNRWRMLVVATLLWAILIPWQGLPVLSAEQWWPLTLSGLAGIFIGDSANYAAMNRLGPRRTGVLFATNAIFTALLGFALLDERMSAQTIVGATTTVAGVMIALAFGRHRNDDHAWEATTGHPAAGIAFALLAALSQSVGVLLAKPVMAAGIDAIAASAVRVSVAMLAHFALGCLRPTIAAERQAINGRILAQTAFSGSIGMGLGMLLLLAALRQGDAGVVAILSAVTPIFLLPVLWLRSGRPPAAGAWLGALLTVGGTAIILAR